MEIVLLILLVFISVCLVWTIDKLARKTKKGVVNFKS